MEKVNLELTEDNIKTIRECSNLHCVELSESGTEIDIELVLIKEK